MIYPVTNIIDGQPCFKKTVDQVTDEFHALLRSCGRGEAVEAIKHSADECISDQQNAWLHCKAGPIMYLVDAGWDFYEAKRFLKVKYGRKIFVRDMTNKNCNNIKGYFFWECRAALCRKIIHPHNVIIVNNKRVCKFCNNKLSPIVIKSINDVAISRINKWFDVVWEAYPLIKKPDPKWKQKKESDDESNN